jgi:(2Fe-2S) ferredoxin
MDVKWSLMISTQLPRRNGRPQENGHPLLHGRRLHVVQRRMASKKTRTGGQRRRLENEVEVRGVGCMKLCCEGPLVSVDPKGALYEKVTPEDARELIATLKGGKTKFKRGDLNAPFSKSNCPSSWPTAARLIPNASRLTSPPKVIRRCTTCSAR